MLMEPKHGTHDAHGPVRRGMGGAHVDQERLAQDCDLLAVQLFFRFHAAPCAEDMPESTAASGEHPGFEKATVRGEAVWLPRTASRRD